MKYTVEFTDAASRDLKDITRYIRQNSGSGIAKQILSDLSSRIDSLRDLPERGNIPKEMLEIGPHSFRELHYKPYRILYSTRDNVVTVLLVADGRRDMQTLLRHRLLND